MTSPHRHDVLVVGGGPAGAACAYWLADAGHDVLVVEKKRYPREKTCGDGLTPRSVRQLYDLGLKSELADHHAFVGLRATAFGRTLDLRWPEHPDYPDHGYVVTRKDLDHLVAERAVKAGATLWQGAEAVAPVLDSGILRGAVIKHKGDAAGNGRFPDPDVASGDIGGRDARHEDTESEGPDIDSPVAGTRVGRSGTGSNGGGSDVDPDVAGSGGGTHGEEGDTSEVRARYVVVADGANSRFGRALGTTRDRSYPQGMAIRGYYNSPRHAEEWIESSLDVRDKAGKVLPGYGWIFPVGDGRVNVGIGLLSTFAEWKHVNTSHLMAAYVEGIDESWGLSPETCCGPPTGGRLPMALSVMPRTGPTWLVVGDAGGAINPFNGEGIAYAYETGRMAAGAIHEALVSGNGAALYGYERQVQAEYATYFKVARSFVKIIGHPRLMRVLVDTGMRSETLMTWALRIMANMLRPDELGPAEAAAKAIMAVARFAPA